MKTIKTRILAILAVLGLITSAVTAAKLSDGVSPSSSTVSGKSHHRRITTNPAPPLIPPTTSEAPGNAPPGPPEIIDVPNANGPVKAGAANTGTGDHTPGTTGTSGQ